MEDVLILTGFMGVGKTATGQELARLLGWDFVDLDREIEESEGQTIPTLFAERGEAYFRRVESEALGRALRRGRTVIATGGGVVLGEQNRRILAGQRVLYLYASADECLRRLRQSRVERPLLAVPDPDERVFRIYEERQALYESLGEKVNTEGLSPEEVASAIFEKLRPGPVPMAG